MQLRAATVTDGYKVGHSEMFADGTSKIYSNLTPRHDKIYERGATNFYDSKLVWVGAQGAVQEIKEMWDQSFFSLPKDVAVKRYRRRMVGYLGGDVKTTEQLGLLHDLGYLPLEIKSIREGSRVPMGIPVMTITNSHPEFYWLTNYLETVISNLTWKTATNATIAAEFKEICKHYAYRTGTDDFTVSIQCHDFSMRGMSGPEDAARSGFAHLTSFIGTDTLPAMDYAEDYYDTDPESLIAISVPATEHAVSSNNIIKVERELGEVNNSRLAAERLFMKDLITRKFPTGIVSYVADTYDFWGVVTDVIPSLKEEILARETKGAAPGKLVIRPDSGDPVDVICGEVDYVFDTLGEALRKVENIHYEEANEACGSHMMGLDVYESVVYVREDDKHYRMTTEFEYNHHDKQYYYVESGGEVQYEEVEATPEMKGAVQCLWETFGGTITERGYKLLDSHIGLIYGDSITRERAVRILDLLEKKGFASGNIVFGIGSFTMQYTTRDTFGFAVKATYSVVNGEPIEIFKDPKTDSKKKSAKGLLFVGKNSEGYFLEDQVSPDQEASEENHLKLIFKDGVFVKRTNLQEIRERIASYA